MDFLNLNNQKNLISNVILYPLKVNRDDRGILVETLKNTWSDIFNENRPFTQNYYSITKSQTARDEDKWHVHKFQEDRFIVISGNLVVSMYDPRISSKTSGVLNLFKMGEDNGDNGQYLLLIPKTILHGFVVVGKKDAILTNYPTRLYDPHDEGRVSHADANVKFPDGSDFSWEKIIEQFRNSKKYKISNF